MPTDLTIHFVSNGDIQIGRAAEPPVILSSPGMAVYTTDGAKLNEAAPGELVRALQIAHALVEKYLPHVAPAPPVAAPMRDVVTAGKVVLAPEDAAVLK